MALQAPMVVGPDLRCGVEPVREPRLADGVAEPLECDDDGVAARQRGGAAPPPLLMSKVRCTADAPPHTGGGDAPGGIVAAARAERVEQGRSPSPAARPRPPPLVVVARPQSTPVHRVPATRRPRARGRRASSRSTHGWAPVPRPRTSVTRSNAMQHTSTGSSSANEHMSAHRPRRTQFGQQRRARRFARARLDTSRPRRRRTCSLARARRRRRRRCAAPWSTARFGGGTASCTAREYRGSTPRAAPACCGARRARRWSTAPLWLLCLRT